MISTVIMAGGKARRMGGKDKAFIKLQNKPILSYIIEKISTQTDNIVLNSNNNPVDFLKFKIEVIPDVISGHPGPLAGILTGMEWSYKKNKKIEWIVSLPVDSPFFPDNLVMRLYESAKKNNKLIAVASSLGRTHPVFAIWNMSLRVKLKISLNNGVRKIDQFTENFNPSVVYFEDKHDPFFNINTPEDIKLAEKIMLSY